MSSRKDCVQTISFVERALSKFHRGDVIEEIEAQRTALMNFDASVTDKQLHRLITLSHKLVSQGRKPWITFNASAVSALVTRTDHEAISIKPDIKNGIVNIACGKRSFVLPHHAELLTPEARAHIGTLAFAYDDANEEVKKAFTRLRQRIADKEPEPLESCA